MNRKTNSIRRSASLANVVEALEGRQLFSIYYIGPNGNDTSTAPTDPATPFLSLKKALDVAVQGDTVRVKSGVYRPRLASGNVTATFKADGITLEADPAATSKPRFLGSEAVTNWTALPDSSTVTWSWGANGTTAGSSSVTFTTVDGIYRAPWANYFHAWADRLADTNETNNFDPATGRTYDARDMARNQFFIVNDDASVRTEMLEVPRAVDLKWDASGTAAAATANARNLFFIEGGFVYVRMGNAAAPTSVPGIEGTNMSAAFVTTNGFDDLTIRGLAFERMANAPQANGAVRIAAGADSSDNVTIENVSVRWVAGAGMSLNSGAGHVIEDVVVADNGQLGINSTGLVDSRITGGQWLRNNALDGKTFDRGWEAGGCKFTRTRNLIIEGVEVANNNGRGIWLDGDNQGAHIRGNSSHGNQYGIHYEISYTGRIYNNLIYNNRKQGGGGEVGIGVLIASSAGCWIFNNTIWGNDGQGISVANDGREEGNLRQMNGLDTSSYATRVYNNVLAFNALDTYKSGFGMIRTPARPKEILDADPDTNPVVPFAPNFSDHNVFYDPADRWWYSGSNGRKFFSGTLYSTQAAYTSQQPLIDWQNLTAASVPATGAWDLHSTWATDPSFVDRVATDVRLAYGSVAKGRGTLFDGFPSAALLDRNGVARSAGQVDAGAFQYHLPTAWWRFDETSGTALTDSSGGALGLTLPTGTTAPTRSTNAKFGGGSLSFNRAEYDGVPLPASVAAQVDSRFGSVSLWVNTAANYPDDLTGSAMLFYVNGSTGTGDGFGDQNELHLNFTPTERLQFHIEGGTTDVTLVSPLSYNDGKWHHVTATWDVNANASLYVDGMKVATTAHNARTFTGLRGFLGRPDANSRAYTGLLDDVRVFDHVLTETDGGLTVATGAAVGNTSDVYNLFRPAINFTGATLAAFDTAAGNGQYGHPTSASVTDEGRTLKLAGNAWRSLALSQAIVGNAQTLEFRFRSDGFPGQGDIHGIGFAEATDATETDIRADAVKVWGTQVWGDTVAGASHDGSGWTTIKLNLSQFVTAGKTFDRLVFINDDDRGALTTPLASFATSYFSDVRIY